MLIQRNYAVVVYIVDGIFLLFSFVLIPSSASRSFMVHFVCTSYVNCVTVELFVGHYIRPLPLSVSFPSTDWVRSGWSLPGEKYVKELRV